MSYFSELCRAMQMLASDPSVIFVGQAVVYHGTAMHRTFEGIDPRKLVEFPVAEDLQLGFCTGLSLTGHLPVCIYPRWNFLLLATNQLVLHLDKLSVYSGFRPKVLIRTAVASGNPLNPGPQHLGDFTDAFKCMLKTVDVETIREEDDVIPAYRRALRRRGSTLLVEMTEKYA